MGKKRVHELAKEFGLDNREVVAKLQAAGMQVKTHSSSVYEEEARAILTRGAEPEEQEAPVRPGMVIVRKRRAEAAVDETATSEQEEAVQGEEQAAPAGGEPQTIEQPVEAQAEPSPPAEYPEVSGEQAETAAQELEHPVEQPVEQQPFEESARDEAAGLPAEQPQQSELAVEPPAPGESEHAAAQEPAGAAGPAQGPKPRARSRLDTPATVVRMIDREKLLERVPQRRLGAPPGAQAQPRFGKVTELKVVTDPFGRGREMIDVGRDKKGAVRTPAGKGKKTRAPTKREMVEMRERSLHPSRLRKKKTIKRTTRKTEVTQPRASKRVIKMKETIQISDLAHQLGLKAIEVVQKLMSLGTMTNVNGSVDLETAQLVAQEYEYTVESVAFSEESVIATAEPQENEEDLEPRPPVVTVMGHVDHGKTSLLDYIRKTRVAKGEAGGITQHIGAYQVKVPKKGVITFLDTPGHAAFTEMRARGAQVTDIVILVVAADDGVMPQTEEAIRHAQAAGVPIVVAVNKIDRPEANADRVLQQLAKYELVPEAWGGETLVVNTSATKGTGVAELLEAVLLQAEMLEVTANPKRPAMGIVVEAQLDKGRGPVATLLVKHGTLRRGDAVVVGDAYGKIRAMTNDQGKQVKEAGPSAAVEITGLDSVPEAGEILNAVETPEAAREVAEHRRAQKRTDTGTEARMSLEDLMARMQGNEQLELKLVLKCDVKGSVEAVREAVTKLSTEEVKVNVIHGAVGAVNESDIMLASASNGIVLGFNVRPDANATRVAEREGVQIRTYKIIYEIVDDVRKAMEGLLTPESKEKVVGHAEVRDLFKVAKVGTIAGCRVTDGKALRSARVRVLRDSVPVHEGRVASLKHFKDDVREVESGAECGVLVEGFNDIKLNDVIEFFQVEEIARTLDGPPTGRRPPGGVEAHP